MSFKCAHQTDLRTARSRVSHSRPSLAHHRGLRRNSTQILHLPSHHDLDSHTHKLTRSDIQCRELEHYKIHYVQFVNKSHTHTHPFIQDSPGELVPERYWISLKQETVSGSGISWAICKSAPRSRQITTPVPHHSVFTGRIPFLPPNQQRQSTEG